MIETFIRNDHTLVVDRTNSTPKVYRVSHEEGISIIKKAGNLAKASVNHILKGRPEATQETINKRFSICETCEFLMQMKMECGKCGCGIKTVKGKISKLSWDDSKCPVGKW